MIEIVIPSFPDTTVRRTEYQPTERRPALARDVVCHNMGDGSGRTGGGRVTKFLSCRDARPVTDDMLPCSRFVISAWCRDDRTGSALLVSDRSQGWPSAVLNRCSSSYDASRSPRAVLLVLCHGPFTSP